MFKIGADPELFLMKGGKFISAETAEGPLIPGTKAAPYKTKYGGVQVDGVAAEFNIDPATSADGFYNNIKATIKDLNLMIKKKDKGIQLAARPTATFDPAYFKKLPKHTLELGCEPDWDAYSEKPNPRPSTKLPLRTASGHVHIGWTKDANPFDSGHMMDCVLVAKELDKYLYHASLDWDKDETRRQLYGKVGSFRPKPYGMEYRVLSNAWLKNPETVRNVYLITSALMKSIDSGRHDIACEVPKKVNGSYTDWAFGRLAGHVEW